MVSEGRSVPAAGSSRWVAAQPADCGPYQLLTSDGTERRLSLRSIQQPPLPTNRRRPARCCQLVPLRRGVIVIACVIFITEILMTAAAVTLHCLVGDMIRTDLWPRLWLLRAHNVSSPEQHRAAMTGTDAYISVLERGLLAVAVLAAIGVVTCMLLMHAARTRRACLLLPWLVWHGCLLLLGSAVSVGGLVMGAVKLARSWLICSAVGLLLAAVMCYWYVQVLRFYLRIKPLRSIARVPSRHDTHKPAPLALSTHDSL